MAGRSSGRYLASHPSWFRKQRGLQWDRSYPSENHAITDTTSSFRPETLLQPYPLPPALPNSHNATIQQKLEELTILARKFNFPDDAHKILEWANIRLRQGDEGFLNNKLELQQVGGRLGIHDVCHGIVKFNGTTTDMAAMNHGILNSDRCILGWHAGINATANATMVIPIVTNSTNSTGADPARQLCQSPHGGMFKRR
jgi:hypothetical protein